LLGVLFAALLFHIMAVALVPPVGEFPVNDDWAYYRIAKHWAETGEFAYIGWNQMMLVTQAALGAAFIKLFGFSFTGPRILVLALGVSSLVALYGCGREAGLAPILSGLATASVVVCPLYLYSAYSFMTEVPFLAFFGGALWGYARFLRTGSRGALTVATLLALAAFMLRQTALLLPIGALLAVGWQPRRPQAKALWAASLLVLTAMGLALLWRASLPNRDDSHVMLGEILSPGQVSPLRIALAVPFRAFCALQYLGLYLLPLILAFGGAAAAAVRQRPRLAVACAAVILTLTVVVYVAPPGLTGFGRSMPYLNQYLGEYPFQTDGTYLRGQGPLLIGRPARAALTAAAIPGATLLLFLLAALALDFRRRQRAVPDAPSSAGAADLILIQWMLQLLFVAAVTEQVFERYYLLLLGPAALLLVGALPRADPDPRPGTLGGSAEASPSHADAARSRVGGSVPTRRAVALPAFLLLAAFSTAFTLANLHDAFALYGEVAAAVRSLSAAGIPPERIDAGFAWSGWYHPGPVVRRNLQPRASRDTWYLARVFPTHRDDFVVAMAPAPDRPVVARRSYRAWLLVPGAERTLWLLGPKERGGTDD